ncbi:MAG TPA: homoserine kinase [Alphaproteobacteria bacterium]|nr:homoserine kinase [Alphaproteobacteria bacterium]
MAVYTEVSDEELEAFIADYDIGEVISCKGVAEGVENSNYMLRTDGGDGAYFLTLYEKRVAAADLPYFIGLMEYLAGRGISCPLPVHARDGKALRTLAGRPAAIVTFLDGVSVRRPRPQHCAGLGDGLARLHLAGGGFPLRRPNGLTVPHWRPLFMHCASRADNFAAGLRAELEAELTVLENQWPANLPSGVIHADAFPDNVFFLHDRLSGFIDFYFACDDMLAYDIAICLNAWCFEADGAFNVTKARLMLTAYQAVRPLSAEEMAALPLLARGSALRFLLTRLHDWLFPVDGALVKPKDPLEYLHKLRFHRDISGPGAYGIDA